MFAFKFMRRGGFGKASKLDGNLIVYLFLDKNGHWMHFIVVCAASKLKRSLIVYAS